MGPKLDGVLAVHWLCLKPHCNLYAMEAATGEIMYSEMHRVHCPIRSALSALQASQSLCEQHGQTGSGHSHGATKRRWRLMQDWPDW